MLTFYKASPSNNGASCSWSYRPAESKFFVKLIKQASWNGKTGSFKDNAKNPEASISCKFDPPEIGAILSTIEKGIDFSTYHRSEKQNLQIAFKKREYNDKNLGALPGFMLALTKTVGETKVSIFCGFTVGESRALREYLITALQDHFRRAFMWTPERREESAPIEEPETVEHTARSGNEEYLPTEQKQTTEAESGDLW